MQVIMVQYCMVCRRVEVFRQQRIINRIYYTCETCGYIGTFMDHKKHSIKPMKVKRNIGF
jgi:hypothetical protein